MWAHLLLPAGSIRIICAVQCTNTHSAQGPNIGMIEASAEPFDSVVIATCSTSPLKIKSRSDPVDMSPQSSNEDYIRHAQAISGGPSEIVQSERLWPAVQKQFTKEVETARRGPDCTCLGPITPYRATTRRSPNTGGVRSGTTPRRLCRRFKLVTSMVK